MSWTEERIALLKRLWEGGATASQIAEELTGVSRNAVIGKAHRLGLKPRPSPVKSGGAGRGRTEPAAPQPGLEAPQQDMAAEAAPQEEAKAEADPAPAPAARPREDAPAARAVSADPAPPSPVEATGGEAAAAIPAAPDAAPAPQEPPAAPPVPPQPRIVSVGPGGFLRQGPGDQQAPIPPAPPRRLVPAKPSPEIADKTSLLDLNDKVCRWPLGHPGEADFHFCGEPVNPGFPYCVEHCGRAYQAQLPRGVRRPSPPLPFGGPRVR
ncbi:GcrA cell cycle regulator [Erythrobacteraceae bacterium CFH 75059]|uniref:GcrA family cell cycle regulator n=1 Tax=Qipengyuania thermophila TaxID=2509361 RepID=UPI00102264E6|nr:GcrA family cell cycle regulator [Qipengyuania thermophila]TCD04292.1 GcrA cell cycle regulator [Erythrobacteraceae bacterium CFH 75059]